MAEWAPPLPRPPRPPLPPPPRPPPPLATYVVQVPKDQIYRVPPPENARIVEEHRKNLAARRDRRPPCLTFLYRLLLILLIIGVVLSALALVLYIFAKPSTPTFTVDRLLARSAGRRKPEFVLTMTTSNPSGHMSYTFVSGGTTTLSHRGSGVATGDTPDIDVAGQEEAVFKLVLHSTKSALPSDLEKSLKGTSKAAVAFTLSASFPVRLKVVGVTVRSTSINVACDIRTSGLAGGTRVVSQACSAKLQ